MDKTFFIIATTLAGLAVALGAFGAHALDGRIESSLLNVYETGVRYHFYHAIGLIVASIAVIQWPSSSLPIIAGWLFVAGILLFSGSLYILALSGIRWLGAITPLGGVAFIGGWACLALAALRS